MLFFLHSNSIHDVTMYTSPMNSQVFVGTRGFCNTRRYLSIHGFFDSRVRMLSSIRPVRVQVKVPGSQIPVDVSTGNL
jgi:hypothetical protein